MIQQTSQPITFLAFFTASKQGKTGLTVTVNIYTPAGILLGGSPFTATEIGDGIYSYTLASPSQAGGYVAAFKTTDTSVDMQTVPSCWEVGVAGVDRLDAATSSRQPSGAVTVSGYAAGQSPASQVLATPANKLATNGAGQVSTYYVADKTGYSLNTDLPSATDIVQAITDQYGVNLSYLDTSLSGVGNSIDNLGANLGSPMQSGEAVTVSAGSITAIASAVWSATGRTLSSFGALVSDAASAAAAAVWGAATRTLSAAADTAGTTTLLSRLTAQRAANLDHLDENISSITVVGGSTTGSGSSDWIASGTSIVLRSASSAEYLAYPLSDSGDPTSATISFALASVGAYGDYGDPTTGEYVAGGWHQDTITGRWYGRVLVGPSGTLVPDAGFYRVYCRIVPTDGEAIARAVGYLRLT